MADTGSTILPRRKRRRTTQACTFCQRRKLRCGNEQPRCLNCQTYSQECTYVVRHATSRPTKTKIQSLEEENRRLRAQLSATITDSVTPLSSPRTTQEITNSDDEVESEPSSAVEGVETNRQNPQSSSVIDLEATYHGTTSTLFNADAEPSRPMAPGRPAIRKRLVASMQNNLIAAATRQRQLEKLNFNTGKLDFDGVDPELGMHLLEVHWARQHHSFLITYRPAFMRDMACRGPYFSKLLLNAIYFGASKFSPRLEVRRDEHDVRTAGWQYRTRVKDLLADALDKSGITTIQALLVMTNSLFALGDERSAAWLYAGIAIRMAVDLGLHIDGEGTARASKLTDEDLEIRRRVYWAAFVVDKMQSLYQGRPTSLQHFDAKVPLTFLDTYEEFEHWEPFAYPDSAQSYCGSPAYSVSTFTELCRLSVLMNKILNKMYSEEGRKRPRLELFKEQESLRNELQVWRKGLPDHLDFDPSRSGVMTPPPHVLSLLAMYEVMLVILHRPFVAEGHLHLKEHPTVASDSFSICVSAASSIVALHRIYDRDFSIKRAPYLIAYATYVAATIHVRVAAQFEAPSNAHSMLEFCLYVFEQNHETNSAVKRAELVVGNLMTRMGVTVSETVNRGVRMNGSTALPPRSSMPTSSEARPVDKENENLDIDIDQVIQSFQPYGNSCNPQPHATNTMASQEKFYGQLPTNTISNEGYNDHTWTEFADSISAYPPVYDLLVGFSGSPSDLLWGYSENYEANFSAMSGID